MIITIVRIVRVIKVIRTEIHWANKFIRIIGITRFIRGIQGCEVLKSQGY